MISIDLQGDPCVEPGEQFMVLLQSASAGAIIVTNHALGTILNDDPAQGANVGQAGISGAATTLTSADFSGDGLADTLRSV